MWRRVKNTTNFGSEDDLKVGTSDAGTHVARSYVNFPLGDGLNFYDETTVVDSARLKLFEWHAASCTKSIMEVSGPPILGPFRVRVPRVL